MADLQLPELDPCVHCGFCLEACPTYRITGDEAEGPRGRIVMMRNVANGSLDARDASLVHLDHCIGCRGCEPACPSGVRYGAALGKVRELLVSRGRTNTYKVEALLAAVARPRVRHEFFRTAGEFRPLATRAVRAGLSFRALRLLAATHQHDQAATEADAHPLRRGTVALFRGCIADDLFAHVHDSTARVLQHAGYDLLPVPNQTCCGALHAHAGQGDTARALAAQNSAAFASSEVPIVVNSAGCSAMLAEYDTWTRHDSVSHRVWDVMDFLAQHGYRPQGSLPLRVVYDPPCHLLHAQGIHQSVVALLESIPQIELLRHRDAELCCGAGGSYALSEPEMSDEVTTYKVDAILESEPAVVVTGNPGCIMQLGSEMLRRGVAVPVLHPVEILDWAGAAPPAAPPQPRRTIDDGRRTTDESSEKYEVRRGNATKDLAPIRDMRLAIRHTPTSIRFS
ncbi:MAG: (Fe-S)-binding protein [Gemmatimonadales bacterium]